MRTRKLNRPLLPLLLIFSACSFFPGEYPLGVELPRLPAELSPYISGAGVLEVWTIDSSPVRVRGEAGEVLRVELPRTPITTLRFLFDAPIPAAGAVLPYDGEAGLTEEGRVRLTFRDGTAAGLTAELVGAGLPAEAINYLRLRNELAARSGGNPNLLDYERLRAGLRSGSFSSRDIRMRDAFLLPAESLPAGKWHPCDPLAAPLAADREERVYLGRSTLIRGGERGVLWVDGEGWRFYSPEGLFDLAGEWR